MPGRMIKKEGAGHKNKLNGSVFRKKECVNVHSDWIMRQLMKNNSRELTWSKGFFRERKEWRSFTGRPFDAPTTDYSVHTRTKSKRQFPQLVVESVETQADYEKLREIYLDGKFMDRIENLLVLCWSLKEGALHCVLEQYKSQKTQQFEGCLQQFATFKILPAVVDILEDLKFTWHDITRDGRDEEVLTLSLNDLRVKAIDVAVYDCFRIPSPLDLDAPATNSLVRGDGDSSFYFVDKSAKSPASESSVENENPKPMPSTPRGVAVLVNNVINALHLDRVYPPDRFIDISKKIARNLLPAMNELGLPHNRLTATKFIELNMFEQYFYLDDSWSMAQGKPRSRYELQKETVRRLAPLSSKLTGNEMHLRYINHSEQFNKLSDVDISAQLDKVQTSGSTRIGSGLYEKIVKPLMEKLRKKEFENPVVVTIITDGEPYGEPREKLRKVICDCKDFLKEDQNRDWGFSAILFNIHYIGNDDAAAEFIEDLQEECSEILFCNTKPLDEIVENSISTERNEKLLNLAWEAIKDLKMNSSRI